MRGRGRERGTERERGKEEESEMGDTGNSDATALKITLLILFGGTSLFSYI